MDKLEEELIYGLLGRQTDRQKVVLTPSQFVRDLGILWDRHLADIWIDRLIDRQSVWQTLD
jgi:hypothetical protein